MTNLPNPLVLVSDGMLAQRLSVSKSCIRGQRFKRVHSKAHWLTIDPVYVGKCARYRASDVEAWLTSLAPVRTPKEAA